MRSSPAPRYLHQSALLLALLLAAWLRFYRIEYQSYWNDEGNSRAMTAKSAGDILRAAAADIHPPAYYLMLKAWAAFAGESELALRGFSALTGVLLVALLYRLGREYFDAPAGIAAALLSAFNPFLVYYGQEARMYSLLAALSAASFLLFSVWLRSTRPPPSTSYGTRNPQYAPRPTSLGFGRLDLGFAYCLLSALGLYTHYAFPFVLAAQNLAALGGLLAHRRGDWRKRLGRWIGLQLVTFLLFIPWLPAAYRQLTTWPSAREFHPFFSALAEAARFLAFGRTIKTDEVRLALAGVGVLLLLGLWRGGQTITPLIWLVVPTGLTVGFGLLGEAFSKFLLVAVPPLCLMMGNGLVIMPRPRYAIRSAQYARLTQAIRLVLSTVGIWLLGFGTFQSLTNLYFNPAYFRDNYRGIEQYLRRVERPGDAIITISPNQIEAFGYYHRSGAEVFPLPHARPLDQTATTAALADIAAKHARIFVLYWGDEQADPDHFVETWLNANTFKAGDEWYGSVRLATYAATTPAREIAVPVGARFGGITLDGYTLKSSALSPGDFLQITLFWRTDSALKERYKVFVHLYAALDAPPAAQQDGEPGGGRNITTSWEPSKQYADNHGVFLPADLAPGDYTLMIGLYNLIDEKRLPITLGGESVGDRLKLETITVK
ncbi:MAG TPA: glycosyltransferase family 39 protein [Anaerolineales bacterium]|nr:glycosyltransferase family 39 protein [Anaerolineales bacterium]